MSKQVFGASEFRARECTARESGLGYRNLCASVFLCPVFAACLTDDCPEHAAGGAEILQVIDLGAPGYLVHFSVPGLTRRREAAKGNVKFLRAFARVMLLSGSSGDQVLNTNLLEAFPSGRWTQKRGRDAKKGTGLFSESGRGIPTGVFRCKGIAGKGMSKQVLGASELRAGECTA
jgi:hypothetical protein